MDIRTYRRLPFVKKILYFFNWLFFIEKPKKLPIKKQRTYKNLIRFFFEGSGNLVEPVIDIPIGTLGITNIEFDLYKDRLEILITLERPGVLIGKMGRVIDRLTIYLSERGLEIPVKILIKESKLWR